MERISPAATQELTRLQASQPIGWRTMSPDPQTIHQIATDHHRQQERDRQSLAVRLKNCLARAATLSTVSSAQGSDAGYTTTGKTGSKPPAGVGFTQDGELRAVTNEFDMERWLTPIEHHIARLEEQLDIEQGLSQHRLHVLKTGTELDEELIEGWKGVPPHVVATKAPWLGGPRTIERRRAALGYYPRTGFARDDIAA